MTSPNIIQPIVLGQQQEQGFAALLQALQFRKQIGLQREQLQLEAQRTQAQVGQAQAATAESRARTRTLQQELEQRDLALQAGDLATEQFISTLTSPDGLTPEAINAARERIVTQGDKKIRSQALLRFDELLTLESQRRTTAAQATTAESGARVAAATEDETIQAAELANRDAQVQIALREAQTAAIEEDTRLATLRRERDPVRVERAAQLYTSGRTWGEARQAAGLAPGGIPDDATYSATDAAQLTEARLKAQNFARQMIPANATVNALTRQGVRLNITTGIQRAAQSNGLSIAINQLQNAEQQQLLQAGLQYVMAYRFFMSGQQSSDREYLNMIKVTLELPGDSDEVIRQKRVMRELQVQAVQDVAGGTIDPVQVLNDAISTMRAEGMDQRFLEAMEHERDLALQTQRRTQRGEILPTVSIEPTTPDSLARALEFSDSVLNTYFDVRRP